MLNFTWWVNRKDLTGSNVFEVVFWDWIISVSLIAAHPFPREVTWKKRMERPGWHFSVNICFGLRWQARPHTTRATRNWH